MSYNKSLVSSKQSVVIKSITELLEILSEIEISDTGGNDSEIVLDDGSVMTLSLADGKDNNSSYIKKISITNARLNLDVIISRSQQYVLEQDKNIIWVAKKKPEKLIVKLKKVDSSEGASKNTQS